MKKLILAALSVACASSMSAFAADPSVKITSFRYAGETGRTAEICGQLTAPTGGLSVVQIVVDPGSRQGTYHAILRGLRFCTTVVTDRGVADATLLGSIGETVRVTAVRPASDQDER